MLWGAAVVAKPQKAAIKAAFFIPAFPKCSQELGYSAEHP